MLRLVTYWHFGKVVEATLTSDSKRPGMGLLYNTGCLHCQNGAWRGHKPGCPVDFNQCASVTTHFREPLARRWDVWNRELVKLSLRTA